MIVVTGASGTIGSALLPLLLEKGYPVRAVVRDPKRLGPSRSAVQIALLDLGNPHGLRHALRGADAVIHLAATTRDQPPRRVEEINGLGTLRLLREAERRGVGRFVYASALNASSFQRTRFFRSKALAEQAVSASPIETTIVAPSIVYDIDDPWVTMMRRLALLPAMPLSGSAKATFQPIWARDAARCIVASLERQPGRFELVGPQTLSYAAIAQVIAASCGRVRPQVKLPLPMVRTGLIWSRALLGGGSFATWEEAELLEIAMTSDRGDADVRALGVSPLGMAEVLGQA